MLQTLIDKIDYRTYLKKVRREEEDADVMENIDELLADAAELDDQELDRNPLEVFLEQAALYAETDRFDPDAARVNLMTLHAAKGLEFPYVFIIAVEQDILPHRRSRDDPQQMEEERRLLFVGMTRAKEELQLSCAKSRTFRGNHNLSMASIFLMELPRAEMLITDLTEQWEAYNDSWDEGEGEGAFDDFFDRHFGSDDEAAIPKSKSSLQAQAASPDSDIEQHFEPASDDLETWQPGSAKRPTTKRAPRDKVVEMLASKKLRTATELGDGEEVTLQAPPEAYKANSIVTHPTYGSGKIVDASGKGMRRTVTVEFFSDGMSRSFVLKFAKLTLESD